MTVPLPLPGVVPAPTGPAIDAQTTRDGLKRSRRNGWRVAAVGCVLCAVGLGILAAAEWPVSGPIEVAANVFLIPGVVLASLGLAGRVAVHLMARRLARGVWIVWNARTGSGDSLFVTRDARPEQRISMLASKRRVVNLRRSLVGQVWICGDPHRTCVVSLPGGGDPVLCRRSRWLARFGMR